MNQPKDTFVTTADIEAAYAALDDARHSLAKALEAVTSAKIALEDKRCAAIVAGEYGIGKNDDERRNSRDTWLNAHSRLLQAAERDERMARSVFERARYQVEKLHALMELVRPA